MIASRTRATCSTPSAVASARTVDILVVERSDVAICVSIAVCSHLGCGLSGNLPRTATAGRNDESVAEIGAVRLLPPCRRACIAGLPKRAHAAAVEERLRLFVLLLEERAGLCVLLGSRNVQVYPRG
jgi:hypothetical protein